MEEITIEIVKYFDLNRSKLLLIKICGIELEEVLRVSFCDWLISLSIMPSSFIHGSVSFLFKVEWYLIVYMYTYIIIHTYVHIPILNIYIYNCIYQYIPYFAYLFIHPLRGTWVAFTAFMNCNWRQKQAAEDEMVS